MPCKSLHVRAAARIRLLDGALGLEGGYQIAARLAGRAEEDAAAAQVPLSADKFADLKELSVRTGVQGNRHDEHDMSLAGR